MNMLNIWVNIALISVSIAILRELSTVLFLKLAYIWSLDIRPFRASRRLWCVNCFLDLLNPQVKTDKSICFKRSRLEFGCQSFSDFSFHGVRIWPGVFQSSPIAFLPFLQCSFISYGNNLKRHSIIFDHVIYLKW